MPDKQPIRAPAPTLFPSPQDIIPATRLVTMVPKRTPAFTINLNYVSAVVMVITDHFIVMMNHLFLFFLICYVESLLKHCGVGFMNNDANKV